MNTTSPRSAKPRHRGARATPQAKRTDHDLYRRVETSLAGMVAGLFGPASSLGQGEGREVIHQMRVNGRRLRVGLAFWAGLLDARELEQIQRHLRRIGDALGAIRVHDVNRQQVLKLAGADAKVVAPLLHHWQQQRAEELTAGCELLRLLQVSELDDRVRRLLQNARYRTKEQLQQEAARQLDGLRKGARQRLKKFAARPASKTFHKLRIAVKEYRYGLELAAELIRFDAKPRVNKATKLQSLMGKCHDAEVAAAATAEFIDQNKPLATGLRPVLKTLKKEQARRYAQVEKFLARQRSWLKKVRLTAHS